MFFKVTINMFILKKVKIKDEPEGVGPLSDPEVTRPWVPVSPTLRTVPQWQHLRAPAPTTVCSPRPPGRCSRLHFLCVTIGLRVRPGRHADLPSTCQPRRRCPDPERQVAGSSAGSLDSAAAHTCNPASGESPGGDHPGGRFTHEGIGPALSSSVRARAGGAGGCGWQD